MGVRFSLPAQTIMILGYITIVLSLLVIGVGMISQAKKNHVRKSTEGLSTIYFILLAISYTFWLLYGFSKHDYVLIVPGAVGALVSYFIVFQIHYYKTSK